MLNKLTKYATPTLLFLLAAEIVSKSAKAAGTGWYGFFVLVAGLFWLGFVFKFLVKAVNHD